MKWTENRLIRVVANHDKFSYHRNYTAVPNVSHGLLMWEADLLVLSKAGYMTEIEAKISMSDWKADKKKWKFKSPQWARINYFYYVAPLEIALRWKEAGIPEYAGVLGVKIDENQRTVIDFVKQAEHRKATKWGLSKRHTLTRLGVMRYWSLLDGFFYQQDALAQAKLQLLEAKP